MQQVVGFLHESVFIGVHSHLILAEKKCHKGASFFLGSILRCVQIYNFSRFSQYFVKHGAPSLIGRKLNLLSMGGIDFFLLLCGARLEGALQRIETRWSQTLPSCLPTTLRRGCYSAAQVVTRSTLYLHHLITGWIFLQSLLSIMTVRSWLGWGSLITLFYFVFYPHLFQYVALYIHRLLVTLTLVQVTFFLPTLFFIKCVCFAELCFQLGTYLLPKKVILHYFCYPLSSIFCSLYHRLSQVKILSLKEIELPPSPATSFSYPKIQEILSQQDPTYRNYLLGPRFFALPQKLKIKTEEVNFEELIERFDQIPLDYFREEQILNSLIGSDSFRSFCIENNVGDPDNPSNCIDQLAQGKGDSKEKYLQGWMRGQLYALTRQLDGTEVVSPNNKPTIEAITTEIAIFLDILKAIKTPEEHLLFFAGHVAGLCTEGILHNINWMNEHLESDLSGMVSWEKTYSKRFAEVFRKAAVERIREQVVGEMIDTLKCFALGISSIENLFTNLHVHNRLRSILEQAWVSSKSSFLLSFLYKELFQRPLLFSQIYSIYMEVMKEESLLFLQNEEGVASLSEYLHQMIQKHPLLKEEERTFLKEQLIQADQARKDKNKDPIFNFLTWALLDLQFLRLKHNNPHP